MPRTGRLRTLTSLRVAFAISSRFQRFFAAWRFMMSARSATALLLANHHAGRRFRSHHTPGQGNQFTELIRSEPDLNPAA